ncbi:MAG: translation initiation factor IF-2 N-terminal domain-containing protein, partial [Rikenellaceae bacterium]|nr:translation initiation factor IF-2 N-terminal domain-containing protein [Rikenellaceae bacterium]
MANEKKLRINAIARQLNVGHNTVIEFLESKGITLEHGFNSIIDDNAYNLIVEKFGNDKAIEKINIKEKIKTKNETVSLDDIKGETSEEEEPQPAPVEKEPLVRGPKILGKIDLGERKGGKPAAEKKEEATAKEAVQEAPAPVAEPQPEEPKPAPEAPKEEPKPAEPEIAEKPSEQQTVGVSDKTFDERMAEKRDDIFRGDESKLSGPKIVGKIDLSTIEKRSDGASSRKNKRKRIKKDSKVDINDPKNSQQPQNAGTRGGQRNAASQNQPGAGKKKSKKQAPVHTEVSDEEVQKQIKDTLARLTSKGNKSKSSKYRKDKREAINARMNEEQERLEQERSILKLTEFVTVSDLAGMMDVPVTDVITACMNLGLMVSINQRLDAEAIVIVAEEFGFTVEFVTVEIQEQISESEDDPADLVPRPPIVTVMGHVDHGKTSLLDFIRKSNVIEGEAGGITQHIGAYSVTMDDGRKITFLDTPGHEAFTAMRARGASVTDVAIIIVAADDSVMPQTVEAINHASAAGVPIVFAINKIDKPGANPDHIREQLAAMNYLVEDWGGKYQCQEISAKQGINVDALLEKVLLEAEMLDLKANPNKRAGGVVIESALDKGRGYVSTVLR